MNELFNPHSNEWLLNKFDIYKELRARETAYFSKKYNVHVITRYNDVKYALSTPEIFSSSRGNLIRELEFRFGRTLGASDNPMHDVFKNIVKNAYSKDNIQRIRDRFAENARRLLAGRTHFNVSEVIEELSAWATAEILNLPVDKEHVKNLVFHIQRHSRLTVSENINTASTDELNSLLKELLTNKVVPSGPGIYKEFVENHPENLEPVMSLFIGPTISGASSMTGALQFLTLDLYREGQLENVINDRTLIPAAIDESLRFHASTGRFSRTVIAPVTIHGVSLKPGDRVALCLESANRDPERFPDPDKFILERDTSGHLAFGYGVHACIALAISKSLMTAYLEILLDSIGKYKVTTENKDLRYVMTASGNDDMINNIHIERVI